MGRMEYVISLMLKIQHLHKVHLKHMHAVVGVVVVLVGDLAVGRRRRRGHRAGAHRGTRQDVAVTDVVLQEGVDEVLLLLMVVELHGVPDLLLVVVLLRRRTEGERRRPRRRYLPGLALLEEADRAGVGGDGRLRRAQS